MEFQLWLESRENAYSWLDPNGQFHPVKGIYKHYHWANNYLKSIRNLKSIDDPMEDIYQLKWQRITSVGDNLLSQNNFYGPNFKQKQALIDLAITEKFNRIYYDNGTDEFLIWTAGDQI